MESTVSQSTSDTIFPIGQPSGDTRKRTRDVPQARKRRRYVTQACERCRERKVRCDGARPCSRCRKESVACRFLRNSPSTPGQDAVVVSPGRSHSETFSTTAVLSTLQSLQKQISDLAAKVDRQQARPVSDSCQSIPQFPLKRASAYSTLSRNGEQVQYIRLDMPFTTANSATSSFYSFEFAMIIIKNAASPEPVEAGEIEPAALRSFPGPTNMPRRPKTARDSVGDILSREEIFELIRIFEESILPCHAIFDNGWLYGLMDTVSLSKDPFVYEMVENPDDCALLRLVCGIALLAVQSEEGSTASALFKSARSYVQKLMLRDTSSLSCIRLLVLTSMYYFYRGELKMASRTISAAARRSWEEGFFRYSSLAGACGSAAELRRALCLMWNIFNIDRQYNFAAGFPYATPDIIELPEPQADPFLVAYVEVLRFSTQAWGQVYPAGHAQMVMDRDAIEYLEYRFARWQNSLPKELRFDARYSSIGKDITDVGLYSAIAMLYMKGNHATIYVLRPLLFRPDLAVMYPSLVTKLLEVAIHTVRVLTELHAKTNILRRLVPAPLHFLGAALAPLFLALAGSLKQDSLGNQSVRESLAAGVNLLRSMASYSRAAAQFYDSVVPLINALGQSRLLAYDDLFPTTYGPNRPLAPPDLGQQLDVMADIPPPDPVLQALWRKDDHSTSTNEDRTGQGPALDLPGLTGWELQSLDDGLHFNLGSSFDAFGMDFGTFGNA